MHRQVKEQKVPSSWGPLEAIINPGSSRSLKEGGIEQCFFVCYIRSYMEEKLGFQCCRERKERISADNWSPGWYLNCHHPVSTNHVVNHLRLACLVSFFFFASVAVNDGPYCDSAFLMQMLHWSSAGGETTHLRQKKLHLFCTFRLHP